METTEITPESPDGDGLTPGQQRMRAAHDARRRAGEERRAKVLRERKWLVLPPEALRRLELGAIEHGPHIGCPWCDGYRAALLDVAAAGAPDDATGGAPRDVGHDAPG